MLASTGTTNYNSYKNSGLDFVRLLPTSWDIIPIRAIFNERNEKNIGPKTDFILSVTRQRGVIPYDEKGAIGNNKSEDIEHYKIVYEDDLVINKMNVVIGSLGLSKYYGALSQVYIVLKPKTSEFNIKYYAYMFLNEPFYKSLIKYCTGIMDLRESLDRDEFKKLYLPYPSQAEQNAIALFLDKKTSQINEAIAIKERQIKLLKERKKIIIQKAVTQGLTPNVPMKKSGIDWINTIPEHWEIVRFKNLFTQSRLSVSKNDGVVTAYRDGQVTLRSNRRLDGYTEAILEGGYQGIRSGQLVLNSMDAFEGAIGVSDSDGKCTPEYVICDPKSSAISQYYFAYLLREMALSKYIQVICNAVRQRAVRIRFNNLASQFLILPSREEQNSIVQYIERESKKIDLGLEYLHQQIAKLKEYKTTLINSAVTGKIKVV
ncbi:restriction endonuclease subunit S [Legionella sp. km535]|uniref:restriction endonuclease subunit S n=1 Tax=Legionella sp. km535 TaxID=2498107 RepID=UPI000F8E1880|nr:restriction endonuclease subunit S [Legionella sp. km535]RUR17637.1 restriction endonuclease subunit S [Legionella sp. km535]